MLAMSAARKNNPDLAISWLMDDLFAFDDVGMPTGGTRVPTPYFPGSGSLLLAVGMMAGGWDGSVGVLRRQYTSLCIICDGSGSSTVICRSVRHAAPCGSEL